MVHSIIIPLPLDAHISIKQSIYSENIIINYMTIMIKNYAARLDIVKISVFLVNNKSIKYLFNLFDELLIGSANPYSDQPHPRHPLQQPIVTETIDFII